MRVEFALWCVTLSELCVRVGVYFFHQKYIGHQIAHQLTLGTQEGLFIYLLTCMRAFGPKSIFQKLINIFIEL